MFKKLVFDAVLYFAGQVVNLINNSPRVEGNNITVDLQTDHPVRCSIRLATMSSPLRDCEHFLALSSTYYIAIVYLEASEMFSWNLSCTYTLSHYILPPNQQFDGTFLWITTT